MMKKWFAIIVLIAISVFIGQIAGISEDHKIGITILIFIGGSWITELIPLTITAFLVPVLAYLFHVFSATEALSHFSNPIIYVFIGGFTLANVLNEHGVDKWLAGKVTSISGGNVWVAVLTFFMATAFLSMWMSNTATTAMMLPIGMSIIDRKYPRARIFMILGTAYVANIGGIATLIGSPPNLIAAAALDIDFFTWFKFGLPFTIIFFPILIFVLKLVVKPEKGFHLNNHSSEPVRWSRKKSEAILFFFVVVSMWIASKPISNLFSFEKFDSMVAITATILAPVVGLTTWKKLEKQINWGVLILFGGGLCLSAVLSETGTSELIAQFVLNGFNGGLGLLLILVTITFTVYLTEISSNTGAAAIIVPILMEVALQYNPSYVLPMVIAIGISANCAFMLPVATPPNALAYSTNEVSLKQMIRTGFLLNLVAIPIIWLVVSWDLFNLFLN